MEYSLAEIIDILMKRVVLIVTLTILGLTTFFIYTKYFTQSIYTASVQMYVNSTNLTEPTDLNELNYAQQITATYVYLLRTKAFYDLVAKESGLTYNANQLKAMTVVQPIEDTEIFQISVTTLNPEDSYQIVKTMQDNAPKLIKSVKSTAKISVVDPVVLPSFPSGPNTSRITIVGGMLGFMLSIIITFLLEILDVNVKNREDLMKKYGIPVLGAIPNYNRFKPFKRNIQRFVPRVKGKTNRESINGEIDEEKIFEVSEAYKELRANLQFTLLKNTCKKIVISSPMPQDGKSTTSTNVAITIAQMGSKVLLIDCDLRKGRIHNYFDLHSKPGISDILSGMANDYETIHKTQYSNLDILPMGTMPPNPTELLGSEQMESIILKLEKNYDYLIIDSPPVNIVSDSLSLIKVVDGVVLVVREGITSHQNIIQSISKYQLANTNILGFVLNGVIEERGKVSKSKYNYYYNGNKNET